MAEQNLHSMDTQDVLLLSVDEQGTVIENSAIRVPLRDEYEVEAVGDTDV